MPRIVSVALALVLATASLARADEGMWTYDNFPDARVAQSHGFTSSAAFLEHLRKASLRVAGGCSASFVSPQGLVMTNHHCVVGCVGQLSTQQRNYVQSGFYAQRLEDEVACPNFELDQLVRIEDITASIAGATAGKTGAAANAALHAAEARAQQTCGKDPAVRCDVVPLYHGGLYDLYHYKRYTDVRLAFAPEYAVAQFGGDPDNFNFPRFDFDIGLLRTYENGRPAAAPDYLPWSAAGSKAGDLVFVSGNPGATERELTTAQLAYLRDVRFPQVLPRLAELRGVLEEFQQRGPQQQFETNERLFFVGNTYKANFGRQGALDDPTFFGRKRDEERALRAAAATDSSLAGDTTAWDDIARLQPLRAELAPAYNDTAALGQGLFGDALTLVRAAAERKKPNNVRLPEYTDQGLSEIEQELAAKAPVYPDYEETSLAFGLTQLRRDVGTDDPLAKKVLGKESPEALAARLIRGTALGDPAVRKALFDGGQAAIDASHDPLVAYAKALDPDFRAVRQNYETRIDAPSRAAAEQIAKARFAAYGTSVDPDATFTLRLSYGTVAGFESNGKTIAPYTTIGGLFERATGSKPYALPASWLAAKSALDLSTPMNLSTTNDIIGGNSGSPLTDKNGDVVGLIFDGNIYSLGGLFGYDATRNRAVAVDSRALLAGLRKVYHADRLVAEIEAAPR